MTWPPPATEATVWRAVRLVVDGETVETRVRQVPLWARMAWIDENADVLCQCCWQLLTVEVLGVPGNGHHASPWAGHKPGVMLPMPEAEPTWAGTRTRPVGPLS